jgi:hypothetical protein
MKPGRLVTLVADLKPKSCGVMKTSRALVIR